MSRITIEQKAGLDFLDLILFNELVVEYGMNAVELRQLDNIIERVTLMTEDRYSDSEAEIIKHMAYYFLEVKLANSIYDLGKIYNIKAPRPNIANEMIQALEEYNCDYQIAFMYAVTEKSTGVDVGYAWEIAEKLRGEFIGYSALVRRDLLKRCFIREFRSAPVDVYCWLAVTGVFRITKNSPDRMHRELDSKLKIRLVLLADYEAITHHLKMHISKDCSILGFLGSQRCLKETTINRILDIQNKFIAAINKPSLQGIPLMYLRDPASKEQVQDFFKQRGDRKIRLRMHTGTLASWLSVMGAVMVELERKREGVNAPAIFSSSDNEGKITETVTKRLFDEYGLRINPDALYRTHAKMKNTTFNLLSHYCKNTRQARIAIPPPWDDIFYISTFIHTESLKDKCN